MSKWTKKTMRNYDYDSWLTSFLDYEDEDDLTDEEIEALIEEARIDWYESNKNDD